MMEHRSFGIDPLRARELQDVAQKITTKFSDGEEFIDSAVSYFMNMWTKPGVLENEFISYTKHMKPEIRNQYKAFGPGIKSKIQNEEKKIPELPNNLGFDLIDSSDFRYPVEPTRCEQIDKIFDNNENLATYLGGRTIKAFLNESIDMFVLLWTNYPEVLEKFKRIYTYLPKNVIDYWKKNFPQEWNTFISQIKTPKKQNKDRKQEINNPKNIIEFNELVDEFKKNHKEIRVKVGKTVINKPPSSLPRSKQALVSQFNTRIFPTKLGVVVLANMIYENKGDPVNYNSFSKKFYDIAKDLSETLKKLEYENSFKRNQRFSTGLPNVKNELDTSKKRFLEYYVGPSTKKWAKRQISLKKKQEKNDNKLASFDGALNSFDLAYFVPKYDDEYLKVGADGKYKFGVKPDNFQLQIGITKKGLDFALQPNPIIDNFAQLQIDKEKWEKPLSKEESKFIKKEILTKFPLEKLLIKGVKATITEFPKKHKQPCEECDSNSYICNHFIDKEFQKLLNDKWGMVVKSENKINAKKGDGEGFSDIPDWLYGNVNGKLDEDQTIQLVHWRTALIGRLSELGELEWNISTKSTVGRIRQGTSYYAIPE